MRKWLLPIAAIMIGLVAYFGWKEFQPGELPEGFVSANGRIEAVEIDVATKTAGRLLTVLVNEGDFVTAGQVLAEMDTEVLKAQLRQAEAEMRRAKTAIDTARSTVLQRESEQKAAEAVVAQRQAELDLAMRMFARREELFRKNVVTAEEYDTERAALFRAQATFNRAEADVAAAAAAIATARSQVIQAEAAVSAAEAVMERIQADINDSILRSPRDGRVQYRIAQPGEVLSAGGKVLNLIDLGDVYMNFFLPTESAGRVKMGTEVRLVLDAAPQFAFPARVSFAADVAQFTPKTVETAEERQKLMFRIKARIDEDILKKYVRSAKTGLPGMAYVRLRDEIPWPAKLEVRLPE